MKTPENKKVCYFAAIYPDKDGGYWTRFVDFPATSQGDMIEDAIQQLTVFLQDIVDEMGKLKKDLPVPTRIEDVKAKLDPEDGDAVCIVPVFAYLPSPTIRVQITARANKIAAIDAYAKAHSLNRSELLIESTLAAIRQ